MGKNKPWLVSIVFVVGGACSKTEDPPRPAAASVTVAPSVPVVPVADPAPQPAPAEPSLVERLVASTTLTEALEIVRPQMTDTTNEVSPGALALALWATEHLRWPDVAVAQNETSFARVRKDPDAARGKRMCFRAQIIQITKAELGAGSVFSGLTLSAGAQIARFIAVGSTGDLVENSGARFCGVVIGTYDYSNSGGGTGHAISVVGMFDLPENRAAATTE